MGRFLLRVAAAAAALLVPVPASADPGSADPDMAAQVVAAAPAAGTGPAAPAAGTGPVADDGRVASSPPSMSTLDGVTLTISAKNETQMAVAPLTTAVSTREYLVGGVFDGSITGSDAAQGVFEVGYQIGCGIDMSTGGGVLLSVSALGGLGSDSFTGGSLNGYVLPAVGLAGGAGLITGQLGVSLKPGIINNVPLTKKTYKNSAPEVEVSDLRVKIDGCVGESFIRSYATLANSTAEVEDIVSWYGVTKAV
ncbi:MAG: MspA family porin [Mycobacterium sp.]|nr:MspA family porin [Mycobacterium sp.]